MSTPPELNRYMSHHQNKARFFCKNTQTPHTNTTTTCVCRPHFVVIITTEEKRYSLVRVTRSFGIRLSLSLSFARSLARSLSIVSARESCANRRQSVLVSRYIRSHWRTRYAPVALGAADSAYITDMLGDGRVCRRRWRRCGMLLHSHSLSLASGRWRESIARFERAQYRTITCFDRSVARRRDLHKGALPRAPRVRTPYVHTSVRGHRSHRAPARGFVGDGRY